MVGLVGSFSLHLLHLHGMTMYLGKWLIEKAAKINHKLAISGHRKMAKIIQRFILYIKEDFVPL